MANAEQLAILKQGVEVWNRWREEHPRPIDLSNANLREAKLRGANLNEVVLSEADLYQADLGEANLIEANLSPANLVQTDLINADLTKAFMAVANLTQADLYGTKLQGADCRRVNFQDARLDRSNLSEATLSRANLNSASIRVANLHRVILERADLAEATLGDSILSQIDFSNVLGLEKVFHMLPSSISFDTLVLSKGKIPLDFLRGCGLSDFQIEHAKLYDPDLSNDQISEILYRTYDVRANQAIQISPLFISYSHADKEFVDSLEGHLSNKGIRYWRDIHDAKAGWLEKQIDSATRLNPTVLLILSEHSIKSDWVEHEVRLARGLEQEIGRDVLCPVALDDSWRDSRWPKRLMEPIMEYNILDFSAWKDDSKFDGIFRKLIDGLELFYKG